MNDPHYLADYQQLVTNLKARTSHEEAMHLAVGGGYEVMGEIERKILVYYGMKVGSHVLDFGCGSGRLASALAKDDIHYTGVDIVQDLLDYAASKTPASFKYILNTTLTIPVRDNSQDIVNAFSVFTHLHQAEIYIYLCEMRRILKSTGRAIVSYQSLTEPSHWFIFDQTVAAHKAYKKPWPHLNMFLEYNQMEVLAKHAGLRIVECVRADSGVLWDGGALGQEIAVLQHA